MPLITIKIEYEDGSYKSFCTYPSVAKAIDKILEKYGLPLENTTKKSDCKNCKNYMHNCDGAWFCTAGPVCKFESIKEAEDDTTSNIQ